MANIITKNPIVISAGDYVTVTNGGTEFSGLERVVYTVAIPQAVGTGSNVEFTNISSSIPTIINDGSTEYKLTIGGISGSTDFTFGITGSVTASGDLNVQGNATVGGTITAKLLRGEITSSATINSSGSTSFGNDTADTHHRTGSVLLSGSFKLNQYNASSMSTDTSLTDGSSTDLPTENAAKSYTDSQASTPHTYFRKCFTHTGSFISAGSASFTAATASAPTGITDTAEDDFFFFLNGQYMEHNALNIEQSGSKLYLIVNNANIGYNLTSDDEIVGWGKFNS
jgi:hypothetical protein